MVYDRAWLPALAAGSEAHRSRDPDGKAAVLDKLRNHAGATWFAFFEKRIRENNEYLDAIQPVQEAVSARGEQKVQSNNSGGGADEDDMPAEEARQAEQSANKDANRNDAKGFIVGSELTVADIALWRLVGSLSDDAPTTAPIRYWPRDLNDRYPLLKELVERIDAHPRIRKAMEEWWPRGKAISPYPGRGFPDPKDGKWQAMGTSLEPPKIKHLKFWHDRGEVDEDSH